MTTADKNIADQQGLKGRVAESTRVMLL